jgi:hypothetical protein
MAPQSLPLSATSFISTRNTNTLERLITRAVSYGGKCNPPKCKPATPKQTMIIVICFAIGCTLILAFAVWWYCWRGRKKRMEFHELLMKEDSPGADIGMANSNGLDTTTTTPASSDKTRMASCNDTSGGTSGGRGLSAFT